MRMDFFPASVYIDPQSVLVDPDLGFAEADLQPRLLFDDSRLWQTVLKLKALIGSADPADRMYAEALGGLLVHELLHLQRGIPASRPANRRPCRPAAEARHRVHGRTSSPISRN